MHLPAQLYPTESHYIKDYSTLYGEEKSYFWMDTPISTQRDFKVITGKITSMICNTH